VAALAQGRKIEAIQIVRQAHGLGLEEAKDPVERHVGEHPELHAGLHEAQARAGRGCPLAQLGLVALILAGWYYLARR
jgi:hypothetical protein